RTHKDAQDHRRGAGTGWRHHHRNRAVCAVPDLGGEAAGPRVGPAQQHGPAAGRRQRDRAAPGPPVDDPARLRGHGVHAPAVLHAVHPAARRPACGEAPGRAQEL
ncbi:hypothetical protein H4R21_004250, partial [Coemansia helicoidea]